MSSLVGVQLLTFSACFQSNDCKCKMLTFHFYLWFCPVKSQITYFLPDCSHWPVAIRSNGCYRWNESKFVWLSKRAFCSKPFTFAYFFVKSVFWIRCLKRKLWGRVLNGSFFLSVFDSLLISVQFLKFNWYYKSLSKNFSFLVLVLSSVFIFLNRWEL